MRNMLKYGGAIMAIATGISILACGGGTGPGGETCTFDDECTAGFVCDQGTNTCLESCVEDLECDIGFTCQQRGGNAGGNTCQPEPTDFNNSTPVNNISTVECVESEECTAGEDGFCDEGVCTYPMPESTYQVIKIEDTSSGSAACEPSSGDPGSDIIAVALSNENGQTIGWGTVVNQQLGSGSNNMFTDFSRIDGNPQSLRAGQCPEETVFANTDVYAMGCGGWLTTRFLDADGNPLNIEQGFIVEVFEYGAMCSKSGGDDNTGSDQYEVYLCEDSAAAINGGSDCNFDISNGSSKGLGNFVVNSLPQ